MPNSPLTKGELLEAIKQLGDAPSYRELDDQHVTENGPVKRPSDRYMHLPETTRIWIEGLRPDDLREIDDVRRWFRNTRIITAFGKWVVVALVAILVATGQVGKAISEIISYFTRAT